MLTVEPNELLVNPVTSAIAQSTYPVLLPVVGAPLPLISYGGTAMLTVFIGLGLVVNVAIHQHLQDNDLL